MSLTRRAILGFLFLVGAMALCLFCAAGTIRYWQGWAYLAVFFGSSLLISVYLFRHDRALLERRMSACPFAEQRTSQKIIMFIVSLGFIALLVLPALDFREGWSHPPVAAQIIGDILVALGFYLTFLVYRANSFTSATIQIWQGQTVISTGPYALVRHPMYAGGLLIFFGTPLALGSYWGLLAPLALLPILIWRLIDEEKFLAQNLPGYTDYQQKVRWRLLPGIL